MNSHSHFDPNMTGPAPGLDRRTALKLFMSGAALALASCGRPAEQVVPYVQMPERMTPGVPLRFATALPLAGYASAISSCGSDSSAAPAAPLSAAHHCEHSSSTSHHHCGGDCCSVAALAAATSRWAPPRYPAGQVYATLFSPSPAVARDRLDRPPRSIV